MASLGARHKPRFRDRRVRRFLRDWAAIIGLILVIVITLAAIFAPWLTPYGFKTAAGYPFEPPSAEFWLGTDEIGRDIFTRIIFGARISLSVGVVASLIALFTGVPLGLISGYFGGRIDTLIMRLMDMLFAFPSIILALAIVAVLGPSLLNAMLAIGFMQIPLFARLVRSAVLNVKELDYIKAAQAQGARHRRVLFRHVLPNTMSTVTVQLTLTFAAAILVEAALSFLGLGVAPPQPSWGAMLDTGRKVIGIAPLYSIASGAAIFITVLSFNLVGDAVRDAFDPHQMT